MIYRIRKWREFQYFKDRKPPWIRLYRELLNNKNWAMLTGEEAKVLVGMWLLASEDRTQEGILPELEEVAFRLRMSCDKLSQIVTKLTKWVEPLVTTCHSETETEAEAETETETESPLPPNPELTLESPEPPKPKPTRKPKVFPVCQPLQECIAELPALWNTTADKAGFARVRGDEFTPDNIKRLTALWDASPLFRECWRDLPFAFAASKFYTRIHADVTKALRIRDGGNNGIPFEKVHGEWERLGKPEPEDPARAF